MMKIDSIKLNYFLKFYSEFKSIINAQLRSGAEWPLHIDIDCDITIIIKKYEWEKTQEAHAFYES